jgi:hypothetical protein
MIPDRQGGIYAYILVLDTVAVPSIRVIGRRVRERHEIVEAFWFCVGVEASVTARMISPARVRPA